MYCVIKCVVRGNQARVKNAHLRHPSCTVVMYRHKSASPVHSVLRRLEREIFVLCVFGGNVKIKSYIFLLQVRRCTQSL